MRVCVNIVIFCLNNCYGDSSSWLSSVCIGVSVGSLLFDYFYFYLLSRSTADGMKIHKKQLPWIVFSDQIFTLIRLSVSKVYWRYSTYWNVHDFGKKSKFCCTTDMRLQVLLETFEGVNKFQWKFHRERRWRRPHGSHVRLFMPVCVCMHALVNKFTWKHRCAVYTSFVETLASSRSEKKSDSHK